ncbi:hypothetical protein [Parvularcula sp. IMCC14364]|uniref:hypothetical protein n=1 Tax=Parvularcula sp. IMCC14364 TaxID=3067902 RepID=UPI002740EB72|nr:hypothetical protein [Parvularcula sp. IMCC14364]
MSGTERISFSDSSGYEIGFGLKRDSFWLSLIAENYSIENTLTGNAEISFEASPEVLPILNSPERSFDSYEQFLDISDLGHSFFGLEVGKFFTENEESKPFISARLGQALLDYDASGAPAPENLLTMLRV